MPTAMPWKSKHKSPLVIVTALGLVAAGCASTAALGLRTSTWHGSEPGRLDAEVVMLNGAAPPDGWVIATRRAEADGILRLKNHTWPDNSTPGTWFRYRRPDEGFPFGRALGKFEDGRYCTRDPAGNSHGYDADGAFYIRLGYDNCVVLARH